MVKIKKVFLKNYCGYRDAEFDFSKSDNLAIMYGQNGSGKSTLLQFINMVSSPGSLINRDVDFLLKKLTFNPDYLPGYENFSSYNGEMNAYAIFDFDGVEKKIEIKNKVKKPKKIETTIDTRKIIFQTSKRNKSNNGIVINELSPNKFDYAYWIDSDHPISLNIFQLKKKYQDRFIDIIENIYGFKCELPTGSLQGAEEYDSQTKEYVDFYTDLIIHKKNKYGINKTHFRNMSAGEKKITKLICFLCEPLYYDNYDIFLIDNIEQHIYFKRHSILIDKLREYFKNKQIIATTHSGNLINYVAEKYGKNHLYDVDDYI